MIEFRVIVIKKISIFLINEYTEFLKTMLLRSIDLVAKNTGSLCEPFRARHESLFIFHALENQTRAFPTVSRNNIHQKIKFD